MAQKIANMAVIDIAWKVCQHKWSAMTELPQGAELRDRSMNTNSKTYDVGFLRKVCGSLAQGRMQSSSPWAL